MKLSVIVPVYNVEDFLKDCLDSLCEQGLSNKEYEIICINDGSKDGSLKILNEYAEKYENIVVIDKENEGVSAARNDGLSVAEGKYIAFCDSDDCIRTGSFGSIVELMEKNNVQVVITKSLTHVDEDYSYKSEPPFKLDVEILPDSNRSTVSPCSFVVEKALIDADNVTFKKGMKYGEDTLFAAQVYVEGIKANARVAVLNTPIYLYRMRQSSAMHTNNIGAHFDDMYSMAMEYLKIKNSNDNEIISDNFTKRIGGVVSTILFDNLRLKKYKPKEIFKMLEKDGLYPYDIPIWTLHNPSLKIKLLNLLKCSLFFKPLYAIYYAIIK